MHVLITGVAGFIGFHLARTLMNLGHRVSGIDNFNDYYDVNLKRARSAVLAQNPHYRCYEINIADRSAIEALRPDLRDVEVVFHLAAQASVQYSLKNPYVYVDSNVYGHLNMLELAKAISVKHFVYASTSSVYGSNTKLPFSIEDRVDSPMAIYAATKRAGELMTHSYSHLYGIRATGFRFFTVYGPWGRPDMAAFLFADKIVKDQPIAVYNFGDMRRNFTYIDDIVAGLVASLDKAPQEVINGACHRIYNLGNNKSEDLMSFVRAIEAALGKKATIELKPMLAGDVKDTVADITETERDFGYKPTTNIDVGIPAFIAWYKEYYRA